MPEKTSLQRELSELAELETFDTRAFQGDSSVPQDVCSFVLSLALIYNDYKDIVLAQILLDQEEPQETPLKSRIRGAFSGMNLHLLRLHVAQMHALLEFVRDGRGEYEHPFFQDLIRQLSRQSRDAWRTVVQVSEGATPQSDLGKALLMIRHKVSSHYDPRMLYRGYSRHFLGDQPQDDRAYISRGNSMATSRFFFADAAAQGVVHDAIGQDDYSGFMVMLGELLRPVNIALMQIVFMFIQRRGFAYRSAKPIQ